MPRKKDRSHKIFGKKKIKKKIEVANVNAGLQSTTAHNVTDEGSASTTPSISARVDSTSSNAIHVAQSASNRKIDPLKTLTSDESGKQNFLLHEDSLAGVISSLFCPGFGKSGTHFSMQNRCGLAQTLVLHCDNCDIELPSTTTCPRVAPQMHYDINSRMVMAMRNIGVGHAGLQEVCRILNMQGMSANTYQKYAKHLQKATDQTISEHLDEVAKKVRAAYEDVHPEIKDNDVIDIAVTYDGI